MQFLINTSLEPFGCALIADDQIVDQVLWDDFRRVGEATWEFLDQHKDAWEQIDFLGGVSGPGGFSNLRVAGVILNALSLRLNLSIHQVRADQVVRALLDAQGITAPFLLNSFGDSVFEVQGESLIRQEVGKAREDLRDQAVCVDFLPQNKQDSFEKTISVDKETLYLTIGKVLGSVEPRKVFVPDYEYPAVQS